MYIQQIQEQPLQMQIQPQQQQGIYVGNSQNQSMMQPMMQPIMVQQSYMQQQPGQQMYYAPNNPQQMMNTGMQPQEYSAFQVVPMQQIPQIMTPQLQNPLQIVQMQGQQQQQQQQVAVDIAAVEKLLKTLKDATSISISYMERNYRGEGGYKFSIEEKNKKNVFAYAFTTSSGNITIETLENNYAVIQLINGTASIYNPTLQRIDTIGAAQLSIGTCDSFKITGEKSGSPLLSFENQQFSPLFCCLCPILFLVSKKLCSNKNSFQLMDLEGSSKQFGEAEYQTDQIKSFRRLDILIYYSKSIEKNAYALINGLIYLNRKLTSSFKSQQGEDDSF